MWHLVFCETMPLFKMWNHVLCESLLWVTHLAVCETLASVRPCLLWDPGFCEALPSVRPWLPWGFAFCETLPSVRNLDFVYLCLFYDALPSVRPCLCLVGETLSSVKPCLYVRFCLPWCVRPCHLFLFIWRCLMGETLPYLALCETLPFEAHSFEDVFDLQETGDHCCPDSPLRITCDGSAHRLCTNLSPWHCKLVLDTIQAHWPRNLSHSSRKLSNSQIVMFLCPLSCCHIFVIIFHYFP